MRLILILAAAAALAGCGTVRDLGIGGEPALMCDAQQAAYIDDRIVGPDTARLSLVRRFKDADRLCRPTVRVILSPSGSGL